MFQDIAAQITFPSLSLDLAAVLAVTSTGGIVVIIRQSTQNILNTTTLTGV